MDAVRIEHAPGRFVARLDGTEAVRHGDVLDIQSTYTPPEQRGRNVAALLTRAALDYARAEGLRVVPTCSYTGRYLERHPEWAPLARERGR